MASCVLFEFGKGFAGRRIVVVRCVYVWLFVHLAKPVGSLRFHLIHMLPARAEYYVFAIRLCHLSGKDLCESVCLLECTL